MEAYLTRLFATNEVVLLAVYGQVFFVLGLSVALQWRRESRLELARSVPLLAAFGLSNAFAIWGDIFIPQQQSLLAANELALLRLMQLLVMLASYTFLLHFGMKLNWNNAWTPRVPWLLAAIGALLLLAGHTRGIEPLLLRLRFEQSARPLFVFTGALLAALGHSQRGAPGGRAEPARPHRSAGCAWRASPSAPTRFSVACSSPSRPRRCGGCCPRCGASRLRSRACWRLGCSPTR